MDEPTRERIIAAAAHHERGGSKAVVRDDMATATDVVERLLPDAPSRREVVAVLGELVEHAHRQGGRRWAVTLFADLVRVNVGRVHVAVVLEGVLFLVVDPARLGEETRTELGPHLHQVTEFASTGSGAEIYLPVEHVASWWPRLRESSLAFVETAGTSDTPYARSHSPGVLDYLRQNLGRDLPRPAPRPRGHEPLDLPAVLDRARQDLPPRRIETREKALNDARELITTHRRSLSSDDLVKLLRLFTTDFEHDRIKKARFGQALGGYSRNRIVERAEVANHWIDTLWSCQSDAEVASAIDRLRQDSPLPGAGMSFPAMVLHCKEPRRYFPAQSGMLAQGYARLTGSFPTNGTSYVRACEGLRALVEEHDLPPVGLDIVAYFADHPEYLETSSSNENSSEPATTRAQEATKPKAGEVTTTAPSYTREQFLQDTLMEEDELAQIEARLRDKPQLVLYGPPGTGKSWIAQRLARLMTEGDDERVELVQFHPSYGYEDFIEGIRPRPEGTQMTYPVVPGVFREFCERASERPGAPHVMIIDEINRGNLPRIFGELLFAVERRGESVRLSQSRAKLTVPPNLVILGTMNTADQSIALFDMALRRRFHFVRVEPDPEKLTRWLDVQQSSMTTVDKVLRELNEQLLHHGVSRDRLVGHSHFMRPELDEELLQLVWHSSITPLLEELFHGRDEVLDMLDYGTFVEPRLAKKV